MAYIKREKMVVRKDKFEDFINLMIEKGVPSMKAKQLVYYPTPMSLIRWAKWLTPEECEEYLVLESEANEIEMDENYDYDDMGF